MVKAHIQSEKYKTLLSDGLHTLIADETEENDGKGVGMTPGDLLLSALGACTAITLRMYADRKGWPLVDVRVELKLETRREEGKAITDIFRSIQLDGDLAEDQCKRLLEIAEKCPVHAMLQGQINIETERYNT